MFSFYSPRTIRFVEIILHQGWQIKLYSISAQNAFVSIDNIEQAKKYLDQWLSKSTVYSLPTYKIATLILHEGKEGCFAILNWWLDENMTQNYIYLKRQQDTVFELVSDRGMSVCVWEMAVLWHERNAWVKHVLMQHEQPNFIGYLADQLNCDI
jgi:hypothetical protein